jgi:hypothetical protein
VHGTTYWFRANVNLGLQAKLVSVTLTDKYHPGRISLNDSLIVFIDGAPQPDMLDTFGTRATNDGTETGWSFDALPLSTGAFKDGVNEIAVMFADKDEDGGLGHLELTVVVK